MSDELWNQDGDDEIPEIRDFSGGVAGKYYGRVQLRNVVQLDADLLEEFPDSESVNRALRRVLRERRKRRDRSAEASTSKK